MVRFLTKFLPNVDMHLRLKYMNKTLKEHQNKRDTHIHSIMRNVFFFKKAAVKIELLFLLFKLRICINLVIFYAHSESGEYKINM